MMKLNIVAMVAFSAGIISSAAFVQNSSLQVKSKSKDFQLFGFFDDLMKGNIGKQPQAEKAPKIEDDELNESNFRNEIQRRGEEAQSQDSDKVVVTATERMDGENEEEQEFDGYMLRDAIYNKWGQCFDVNFQPVTTFGFRELYLNVMPFRLGSKRFRHETELDYLCHLQAIVEILEKYDQLDYVLAQLKETKKKPRAGTSPLVAVPFRLDLTEDELNKIMSNM